MLVLRHKVAQLLLCIVLLYGCAWEVDASSEAEPTLSMDMSLDGTVDALVTMPPMAADATSDDAVPGWRSNFGAPKPGQALIGACPTPDYLGAVVAREDCEYWVVETFAADTEQLLFFSDSRQGGSTCASWVPLGTRITIRTSLGNDECKLLHWRSGFGASQGATCACEQSNEAVCNFTVRHDSYCGAVFGKK